MHPTVHISKQNLNYCSLNYHYRLSNNRHTQPYLDNGLKHAVHHDILQQCVLTDVICGLQKQKSNTSDNTWLSCQLSYIPVSKIVTTQHHQTCWLINCWTGKNDTNVTLPFKMIWLDMMPLFHWGLFLKGASIFQILGFHKMRLLSLFCPVSSLCPPKCL